jgi:hypothetical protein
MQIRIMTLAKNVMTETGVLPVNENTNQARPMPRIETGMPH